MTDESAALEAWRKWKPSWWMDAGYEYDCFMAGWRARGVAEKEEVENERERVALEEMRLRPDNDG